MNANWFLYFFSPIVRKNCLKYVYAINVNYYQSVKKIVQTILLIVFFLNSVEVKNTNKKKKLYINKRLVIVTQDNFICSLNYLSY